MDIIYLIITGMFVGLLSSFFGIGGGSLIMPMLFMLFPKLPAQAIIPSSLGIIFLNSLVNNYHFYQEDLSPNRKTIINLGITCAIGAALGATAIHYVDSLMIKKLFATMMILIALKVFISKAQTQSNKLEIKQKKIGFTGFIGSFISSITGLGGGIVFVPMLVSFLKLPLIYVSSYSNVAMSFATLIGVVPHFFYPFQTQGNSIYHQSYIGHVNYLFIVLIFIGSVATTKLGAKLNTKIQFKHKKILLGCLLILFALKTLI